MTLTLAQQLNDLFSSGRYHDLIAAARNSAVTAQQDPLAAKLLAAALFSVGEFAAAAPLLDELEPSYGLNADFLSLFAANCRRLGQLQKAEELFERALEINSDSRPIRNNYANLLIDLGRLDDARRILQRLLEEAPDYEDARANLNRLGFQSKTKSTQISRADDTDQHYEGWSLADPLLLAFSEEEVKQSGVRQQSSSSGQAASLLEALPDPDTRAIALEQLEQANQAVVERQFAFALQLCSQALKILGSHAPIYDCASDAYLNLKRFHEAELCLLQAIALDSPTPKRCLNLVSFASMRGDLLLAQHHLRVAASLDPSHPQLDAIRSNLEKRTTSSSEKHYSFALAWELPNFVERS